ncbi:hypothetical protein LSAT2_032888, partial [Lamellibrachia satsuma]
ANLSINGHWAALLHINSQWAALLHINSQWVALLLTSHWPSRLRLSLPVYATDVSLPVRCGLVVDAPLTYNSVEIGATNVVVAYVWHLHFGVNSDIDRNQNAGRQFLYHSVFVLD